MDLRLGQLWGSKFTRDIIVAGFPVDSWLG